MKADRCYSCVPTISTHPAKGKDETLESLFEENSTSNELWMGKSTRRTVPYLVTCYE